MNRTGHAAADKAPLVRSGGLDVPRDDPERGLEGYDLSHPKKRLQDICSPMAVDHDVGLTAPIPPSICRAAWGSAGTPTHPPTAGELLETTSMRFGQGSLVIGAAAIKSAFDFVHSKMPSRKLTKIRRGLRP